MFIAFPDQPLGYKRRRENWKEVKEIFFAPSAVNGLSLSLRRIAALFLELGQEEYLGKMRKTPAAVQWWQRKRAAQRTKERGRERGGSKREKKLGDGEVRKECKTTLSVLGSTKRAQLPSYM